LRRALIDTSVEIISEKGVSALTFRELARRLDVSHTAPRHHFSDKNDLLAAIAADGFEALARAQREASEGVFDPWERWKRIGVAYARFAVDQPSRFRVMFGRELAEGPGSPLLGYQNPCTEIMIATASQALATRPGANPADLRIAVIGSWSLIHGMVMLWLDGPLRQMYGERASDAEFKALAKQVADLVVDAVSRGL
jgi:AcrR family transcriptional regulator